MNFLKNWTDRGVRVHSKTMRVEFRSYPVCRSKVLSMYPYTDADIWEFNRRKIGQ